MATAFPSSCACADLFENSRAFADPAMSGIQRQVVRIESLNNTIAGYLSAAAFTTQELVDLGKCCECNFGDNNREAMLNYILQGVSTAVGRVQTAQQLATQGQALTNEQRFLDGIELALWCKFMQTILSVNINSFTNIEQIYIPSCGSLTATGTLPSWLSVAGGFATVAAGTFKGSSQANADGNAVEAATIFVEGALKTGLLTCA